MSLTLADIYYIKALDEYPFALEFTVENLNYALSYDPEHVAANCLMGQLYMEQLKDLKMAEVYLQRAILTDPDYIDAYIHYIGLAFAKHDYAMAEKLISFTKKLKDIDKAQISYYEGLLYEQQGKYCKAIDCMNNALLESFNDEDRNFIKAAVTRIQDKIESLNTISYEIK